MHRFQMVSYCSIDIGYFANVFIIFALCIKLSCMFGTQFCDYAIPFIKTVDATIATKHYGL